MSHVTCVLFMRTNCTMLYCRNLKQLKDDHKNAFLYYVNNARSYHKMSTNLKGGRAWTFISSGFNFKSVSKYIQLSQGLYNYYCFL